MVPLVEVMHAAEVVLEVDRQVLEAVQVVLQVKSRGRHCVPVGRYRPHSLHTAHHQIILRMYLGRYLGSVPR